MKSSLTHCRHDLFRSLAILFSAVLFLLCSFSDANAQLFRPYKCGPVLKRDQIQVFDSLNIYLGIKPGDHFAELGTSSGYYNGAMAVFVDDVTFYLQDIDEKCLNEENLKKVVKHYSKFREDKSMGGNTFKVVIGTTEKTNLPVDRMDVIFSNATFHVLDNPDAIISDLRHSLKDSGTLSIRDEFTEPDVVKYCKDKKCAKKLANKEEFLETMTRNGFQLIDQTDQFGYPVYKFKKSS